LAERGCCCVEAAARVLVPLVLSLLVLCGALNQPHRLLPLSHQGHRDWVEHWDGDEEAAGLKKGWFDDRWVPAAKRWRPKKPPPPPDPTLLPAPPPPPPHPPKRHRPLPPPRVEARNALSKLEYLYSLVNLNRSEMPWGHNPTDNERSVIWEEPIADSGPGAPTRR
jgi:hypothetical protein